MKPLNEIFEVTYGNKLDLNKLTTIPRSKGGVNFVGRSSQNNGVSSFVEMLPNVKPYEEGLITVALGSSKLLSAFVQQAPFYTAQNVAVLRPYQPMTFQQKVYVALAIRQNRFRYSAFGREANRTLRTLLIPEIDEFPPFILDEATHKKVNQPTLSKITPKLETEQWRSFRYDEIFEIKKGYYNKKPPMSLNNADIPFIGATEKRNGVTGFVMYDNLAKYSRDGSIIIDEAIERKLFPAGCITVSNNGSVGEAFYQAKPFTCSHDVNPLYLKDKKIRLTPAIGLFLASIIRAEKYRWGYGRKWRPIRMPDSIIKLPVKSDGSPDWQFMEQYIQTLPYSSQV